MLIMKLYEIPYNTVTHEKKLNNFTETTESNWKQCEKIMKRDQLQENFRKIFFTGNLCFPTYLIDISRVLFRTFSASVNLWKTKKISIVEVILTVKHCSLFSSSRYGKIQNLVFNLQNQIAKDEFHGLYWKLF